MYQSFIVELLQNIAILLAFSMIYENFWIKNEESKSLAAKILTGLIIGVIGIIVMFGRWTLMPGIVFDTRSVLLSITGLFFGGIPTIIAMAMTAGLRIFMGGNGIFMGVSVIVSSGLIGLCWRWFRPGWKEKNYALELLFMGLIVHLVMLSLTVLLPKDTIISTIKVIAFPLLVLYSPATMLLGILMLGQWKNYQTLRMKEKLQEAEKILIGELVIAKEKAEESDRLKTAFLANLSHEIRTPMNAILGFTDLLKESDLSAKKREHYSNIIQKSGQHLIFIIDDIIEISKIETNQVKSHFSKVDLHHLLNEVKQLVSVNLSKDKEIEIRLAFPSGNENHILHTDEVKLKQILINLINNAIKFTEKGWVEFGYEYDGKFSFYVSDTGIGIDKAHHEIIFDRFRQVESDTSIIKGGSGLGLAIAKGYVEMLGGSISIESEYGKGSVFRFSIPSKS